MKFRNEIIMAVAALFAAGIIGCSGSSDTSSNNSDSTDTTGTGNNTTTTSNTTSKITIGAMTKGSVVLNGVHYDDSTAVITADDVSKTAAFLADGMTVKVKGTVNADGRTGIAEKIEVVDEARGAIASIGTDTLIVSGQTVLVDGGTVLAGGATSIASLSVNDKIEVHGGRDDTGVIHATRVEKLAAVTVASGARGAVSGKTDTTFNIGGLQVTFNASTVMVPAGAPFNNGDNVDARLNGNTAIQITVEHLDHPEFEPAEGQEFSVEGMLSGITGTISTTSAFKVGNRQAQLGTSVRIEGGVLADLVDGVKVEAEGHTTTGGILTAEKITIKDNIRIEANADASGSAKVLGMDVKTTSLTRLSSNLTSTASIRAGDGLRIRGFVNRDGSITATRVDTRNTVKTDEMIIQGPVKDINATAHTCTIMGITVSAGPATTARPNDDSGTGTLTMTLDSFFTSLTADRSTVKAKGSFSSGTLTASEIEIE